MKRIVKKKLPTEILFGGFTSVGHPYPSLKRSQFACLETLIEKPDPVINYSESFMEFYSRSKDTVKWCYILNSVGQRMIVREEWTNLLRQLLSLSKKGWH